MKVLLFQLDGKIPNIAMMRITAHHRALGDAVEFRWTGDPRRELWDEPDRVYASAIFEKTRPRVEQLSREFPGAIVGGTGVDVASSLELHGITTREQDYSIYPKWNQSIGFTQRGCRLRCSFCVVPKKEGAIRSECSIAEIWRGGNFPRQLMLLDNDFFGQSNWRSRIDEIRNGGFKVSFNQGINIRFIDDESAEAIASIDYRDDSMSVKRIYTAWDNLNDEERLFSGLRRLTAHGIAPDHIMVYVLIGFWPNETEGSWEHRRKMLRAFGARPYPMPFTRNAATVGFQRFVVGAYDKRFTWNEFKRAGFRPEKLGAVNAAAGE